MRKIAALATALLLSAHAAAAQDVLRGSTVLSPGPTVLNWSGFYLGAHAGYSFGRHDFSNSTQDMIAYSLRNSVLSATDISSWVLLGTDNSRSTTFGGFVGYNTQWDEAVVGIEFNYTRTSLNGASSGSLGRIVTASDNLQYTTTASGNASMSVTDYASLRARFGYVIGNFMPYATIGAAIARANVFRTTSVGGTIHDPAGIVPDGPFGPYVQTENKTAFPIGIAAGIGAEMLFLPNFFVRAEYEYLTFGQVSGMSLAINAVRLGGGVKF